jgi:predicted CxxxxCH...CXXCH cytochrome family protein
MIPKAQFHRVPRSPIGVRWLALVLFTAGIAAAGCTTANSPSGGSGGSVNHISAPGTSVPGWFVLPAGGSHGATATRDFLANDGSSSCTECHGADLTGGISKVSCFDNPAGCHHGPIQNWATAAVHGAVAKKAPGNSGFASCQICHGAAFSGGGSGISCFTSTCHGVSAPHPARPWRSTSGTTTHATTDPENALVCARCHAAGSSNNPAGHPAASAPAGASPGCYNNTLCHGVGAAPHALGATWTTPTSSAFHGLTAKQDLKFCQGCHGAPGTTQFNGGAAPTSCQSSTCHPVAKSHPTRWYQAPQSFPGYVSSHRDAGDLNVSCALCHKVSGPGTGPDAAAPSCFSDTFNGVTCHSGGPGAPNHAVPFLGTTHTATSQAVFTQTCSVCHAVSGASPLSSAPLCAVCHAAGSPLTNVNCTSCHAKPPAGTVYPNIAGRHAKHDALANVTGVCTSCHNNLDSGTAGHYVRANAVAGKDSLRVPPGDAAFLTAYNAKAGSASFDNAALTCANVSCHGAVTAPNWQTGTISVSTDAGCRQCHKLGTAAGSPENNSPFSGQHGFHLSASGTVVALCTDCHNMANGTTGATNHFKFLNTPQMEGPASQTVEPGGSAANYNAVNQTCTVNCHAVQHTNFSWQGGANHPVPFLATSHTTVVQAGFDTNCASCHAVTGISPVASAPSCTVCHQSASALPFTNCASCHAKPPAGTAYPNVAGKHAKHDALATVTGVCGACHAGMDSGSQAHYDRANGRPGANALRIAPGDVAFQSTFNAKAGSALFSNTALTCANVNCHGGVAAPSWQAGAISSATDAGCRQCHTLGTALGSPENNSPFSGLHGFHLSASGTVVALCTDCHDMTLATTGATNHFKFLNTPQMEGPASDTVAPLGVRANYNATNQTCTVTCHSHQHTASSWVGGANHAVPFLATAHTAVTQSGFDGNCATCHAVTGTSPFSLAPTCTTCHQAGSPLTALNCTSCHANPPTGTTYPGIAGKHAKHNALAAVTGACGTCHSGLNTGSQAHYDRANARSGKNALRVSPGDAAFVSTYNAKTGAASFDNSALTCANVSCHGGKVAPSWQTGTITVNSQAGCTSCHASGTTQFNSYSSGRHGINTEHSTCLNCHNTATLATNHFTNLATTAMEGPASATIGGGTTSIAAGNYVAATRSCTPSCHGRQTW